jgi:hydrogenase/urease accessory protein HupE
MQDFWLYFGLGRAHIADLNGYDHILFVVALCLPFLLKDWKKILILVTAFTIGHSITLALAAFDKLNVPSDLIEFLIPVTILITAWSTVSKKKTNALYTSQTPGSSNKSINLSYVLALFFGLIHGLGFSNYLKSLLGKSNSITGELLAFNLGLELGQLIIVFIFLLIAQLIVNILKTDRREWILFVAGGIFCVSLIMALERWPW